MADDRWKRLDNPPPPLFTGDKEKNFVKQINDEVLERVVGQQILYFPISIEKTDYHELYGEAINKTYDNPIRVYARVKWNGSRTEYTPYGIDRRPSITVNFHRRRLTEDQNLYVRVGDFVKYGDLFFEIVALDEGKLLFDDPDSSFEISATCIMAREGKFDGQ
tara:strand:+ start:954 stop:1442 length:489 start_codon:yes stop_codon:yes gene_type:complete